MAFFVLTEKGKPSMLIGGMKDAEMESNVLDARLHGHPTERYVPAELFFEQATAESEPLQPTTEQGMNVGKVAVDAA